MDHIYAHSCILWWSLYLGMRSCLVTGRSRLSKGFLKSVEYGLYALFLTVYLIDLSQYFSVSHSIHHQTDELEAVSSTVTAYASQFSVS